MLDMLMWIFIVSIVLGYATAVLIVTGAAIAFVWELWCKAKGRR